MERKNQQKNHGITPKPDSKELPSILGHQSWHCFSFCSAFERPMVMIGPGSGGSQGGKGVMMRAWGSPRCCLQTCRLAYCIRAPFLEEPNHRNLLIPGSANPALISCVLRITQPFFSTFFSVTCCFAPAATPPGPPCARRLPRSPKSIEPANAPSQHSTAKTTHKTFTSFVARRKAMEVAEAQAQLPLHSQQCVPAAQRPG